MQLINYQQLIVQGMQHLNAWSHLDCIWLSPNQEKVHAFTTNPIPSLLESNNPASFVKIKEQCLEDAVPKFCIAGAETTLEFIFIPLTFESEYQGLIRIGPYITNPLDNQQLSALMHALNVPLKDHLLIRNYYDSLLIIANQANLDIGYIGMNLFGYILPLTPHCYYTENLPENVGIIKKTASNHDIESIVKRYDLEHKLRYAIAASDRELLKEVMDFFNGPFIADRHPDNPLRSAKNMALVLNTILRHAAEDGGLHPFYLDKISMKFSLLIEQAVTRTDITQLQNKMYEDYFLEVKNRAYPSKSPFIRRIIDHIQINLEDNLTLSALSEKFNTKPSNLANQFKKETGYTVSGFTNHLRIENACYYLTNSDMYISDIGRMVGYPDSNYFARQFKKLKGKSPSAYRRKL